jgi:hypothetical protein
MSQSHSTNVLEHYKNRSRSCSLDTLASCSSTQSSPGMHSGQLLEC